MRTLKISNVVYVAMLLYSMTTNGQTLYVPGGTVGTSSNGNVGIGTTGPVGILEVEATVDGRSEQIVVDNPSIGTLGVTTGIRWTNATNQMGVIFTERNNNQFNIQNLQNASIRFLTGTTFNVGERMIITHSGKVGIGTSNPTRNLHISSDGEAAIFLEADRTNIPETANAFIKLSQDGSAAQAILGQIGIAGQDPEEVVYTGTLANALLLGTLDGAGALQFGTNDNVRMTINTSGNVGIGTTDPTGAKLQITGAVGGNALRLDNGGMIVYGGLGAASSGTYMKGGIDWAWGDAAIRVYDIAAVRTLTVGGNAGSGKDVNVALSPNGGNVGIGTTNPLRKLHIESNIARAGFTGKTGSEVLIVGNTADNNWTAVDLVSDGYAKIGVLKTVSGTTMSFGTSNNYTTGITNQALNINPSGNVGIGTVNPTQKLTVNGKILAEEVEVIADVLPDYVFKEDYKLMSLAELDKFIKANKHLPEVPSEKEVMNNGGQVSLGEMNMTLLKKIEELTLYTIDQENNIQKQDEVIKASLKRVTEQDEVIKVLLKEVAKIKSLLKK